MVANKADTVARRVDMEASKAGMVNREENMVGKDVTTDTEKKEVMGEATKVAHMEEDRAIMALADNKVVMEANKMNMALVVSKVAMEANNRMIMVLDVSKVVTVEEIYHKAATMEAAEDTEVKMMTLAAQHTMLNNMLETLVTPICFPMS